MRFFKRTDVIVILSLIVLSTAVHLIHLCLLPEGLAKAEIYYYSRLVKTVDLIPGEDRYFSIPQNDNVVFLLDKEGNISFVSSDCPDKICIKAGKLHLTGQNAACLPNGIVLKIVPSGRKSDEGTDLIVGGNKID